MRMTNHRALNLVGARGRESNVLDDALIGVRAHLWIKYLDGYLSIAAGGDRPRRWTCYLPHRVQRTPMT